ncbi:MAG: hypothetical protein ABI910_18435 [Gemmatimonadota bacterium]
MSDDFLATVAPDVVLFARSATLFAGARPAVDAPLRLFAVGRDPFTLHCRMRTTRATPFGASAVTFAKYAA